jgi:ribosomal protein S18 acetylase RimI-like enzyme
VPDLSSAPRTRVVDPTLTPALGAFTCGGGSSYETEVDQIVTSLYSPGAGVGAVIVAEDVDSGDLIGVCWIMARPLPPPTPVPDAAYVGVIGVHEAFRGWRLPDGATRIGDFLLHDGLDKIQTGWGGGPMPPVWALVAPANAASHSLFERHGFGLIPLGANYDMRYRPRGLAL